MINGRFTSGHWYRFNDRGEEHIGYFLGRQTGFECCVCGKGENAYTFNIWYKNGNVLNYETWGYGKEHLPAVVEDLGERSGVLVDE